MQMSACLAFEVTADDVFVVLRHAGIVKSLDDCQVILDDIDAAQVEHSALYGNDLDEQTRYAHQDLHAQLVEIGLIPPAAGALTPGGET
jgi:hypothetical protein